MTTEDDIKDPKDVDDAERDEPRSGSARASDSRALRAGSGDESVEEAERHAREQNETEEEEEELVDGTPAQLGTQRFVYAAYFAGGITVAFLLSKAIAYSWTRLSLWKPEIGEPREDVALAVAAIIGALVAFYYYRDEKTRTLAEEVASELGQVSWPTRDEVVNSTFVVVVTTFVATAFFALMDRFWGFVTNLVYGA
jgi:preprotein translocase subunit SecE